jgi:hypothetical protein
MRKYWSLIIAVLVLGCGSDDEATQVMPDTETLQTRTFQVVINSADGSNPFGVRSGESFPGSLTYDSARLTSRGPESIAIDSDPTFSLNVQVGPRTFVATEDTFFSRDFPALGFVDGALRSLDFSVNFASGSFMNLFFTTNGPGTTFAIHDNTAGGTKLVEGTFVFNAAAAPVSGRSAWLLLLTGSVGLLAYGWQRCHGQCKRQELYAQPGCDIDLRKEQ